MDLSILEQLIPNLAGWLNVQPATLLLYLTVFCTVSNLIGRLIPDDKLGILGRIRDVAKVLGIYASNRVSTGITTGDVVKSVVGAQIGVSADSLIREGAEQVGSLIPDVIEDIAAATRRPRAPRNK